MVGDFSQNDKNIIDLMTIVVQGYHTNGWMFMIIVRISKTYIFFIVCIMRTNVNP